MNAEELIPKDKYDDTTDKLLELSGEEIAPIIPGLLGWLQDMNWPVSSGICRVLAKHTELAAPFITDILGGTDGIWKYNILTYLLQGHPVKDEELLRGIKRLAESPTQDDTNESADKAAEKYIKTHGVI
ncbi:MAG: DUF5071 domain-containing protein [Oscillospiraceae bacterium]|nr:DUF5071 domain-containing protein [Oscillospiraceae bacterium]